MIQSCPLVIEFIHYWTLLALNWQFFRFIKIWIGAIKLEEKKCPKNGPKVVDQNQKKWKKAEDEWKKIRNKKRSSINFQNEIIFFDLTIFVFGGMNDHQSRWTIVTTIFYLDCCIFSWFQMTFSTNRCYLKWGASSRWIFASKIFQISILSRDRLLLGGVLDRLRFDLSVRFLL